MNSVAKPMTSPTRRTTFMCVPFTLHVTQARPSPGYERHAFTNARCGRPQRVLGSEHADLGRVPGDDAARSEA
jgi:hypothetical protein